MKSIVVQVVEVLYRNPNRPIHRKEITPAKTTGEFDIHKRIKERDRKDFKRAHPTAKAKYNVARKKWEKRAEEVLQRKEEIEKEIKHHLTEITIRTGAIIGYLALVKKWANRVDSLASSIKQKASAFDTADTLEKRNKIDKELWTIKSDSDKALRSMSMYNSLIGAASGLGADRAYKEFKKYTKRRK